ncbi:hypothetical protein N7474_002230 [Penicillium riverlandense]|uniref:uncharacterized protein n=1 Tax=Penicillium riverlandense TaxID=1903569 RepID=UPI0025486C63|nr:uncharacterized protein N7474_002230 [Penicillium riverlandense]KAJ5833919.1 hypothetical protein N7474_002230 [Penicillium riverlandense]
MVDGESSDAGSELSTNNYYTNFECDLRKALDAIQSPGTFASYGRCVSLDPEAYVHDVGAITLPLDEPQARRLIEKARQAPYGKGNETLVDTSVRNTWELDPEQFELKSPGWSAYIELVCNRAARELGVDVPVSAELYKMLLYEKGAMFKAHTDTEKVPGMFATAVVCLPSPHEGGDVVVKHGGEKKIFKTSEAQPSFVSWYSDVSHEILPVTSGYRWVLTYNLVLDPSEPRPSAGLQSAETRAAREIIKQWLLKEKDDRDLNHVYYKLDHEYTEASISLNTLKSHDLVRVQALRGIASELPVDIFLAVLEKKEMGTCENDEYYASRWGPKYGYSPRGPDEDDYHPIDEVCNTEYSIKTLVDLDGRQVVKGLLLDQTKVLQKDCFDDIHPEESYLGYQGNWGPEATHWYRVTAVAVVPRDSTTSFLMESPKTGSYYSAEIRENDKTIIDYFAGSSLNSSDHQSSFRTLKKLCRKIWSEDEESLSKTILPDDVIAKVLQAAIRLQDYDFLKEAARNHEGTLSFDFFKWARGQIAAGEVTFDSIEDSMFRAILAFPTIWQRHEAVSRLVPLAEPMPDDVRKWVDKLHNETLSMLRSQESLDQRDGHAVVDMVAEHHNLDYLVRLVLPSMENKLRASSFALSFLSRLHQRTTEGAFPTEEGMGLCSQIAKSLIRELDISTVCDDDEPPAKALPFPYKPPLESAPKRKTAPVTAKHLTKFVSTLIGLNDDSLIRDLSLKFVDDAPKVKKLAFHTLWLPFLHGIIPVMESNSIPFSTQYYRQIFISIMRAYLDNYVGREPGKDDRNLARQPVPCGCMDCHGLNNFLQDPVRTVGRFPLGKERRHHIHRTLDDARVDCTHETERTYPAPFKLIVTKTFTRIKRAREEWQARKAEAMRQIQSFDQDKLFLLLAREYKKITRMEGLGVNSGQSSAGVGVAQPTIQRQRPAFPQQPPPLGALLNRGNFSSQRIAGVKRKASELEFVDLTGDD